MAIDVYRMRVLTGVRFSEKESFTVQEVTIMASVVSIAISWAVVWTMYFLRSERVATTFT